MISGRLLKGLKTYFRILPGPGKRFFGAFFHEYIVQKMYFFKIHIVYMYTICYNAR